MRSDKRANPIVDKSFKFAVDIVRFSLDLQNGKHFIIANQICKSGTSIGANIREAQNAESSNDFVHKLKLAAKEADETAYWLELSKASVLNLSVEQLLDDCLELTKILSSIIATIKRKRT